MSISSLFQFICGFIIGVFVFTGGAVGIAFVIFTRIVAAPPRPEFPIEQPKKTTVAQQKNDSTAETPASESSEPESAPAPKEELEPGAYKARVTWSDGLALRGEPSFDAQKIGGLAYNAEIIVLQESDDKKWQKVRTPDREREGWVKAGNLVKIE